MKYDFTTVMDRHEKDAIAVDAVGTGGFAPGAPKEGFDDPMWVADMNFSDLPFRFRRLPFKECSNGIWLLFSH